VNFSVLREIQILKELKHVNLVELLDVRVTEDGLELVLDFCETDLKKVIENKNLVKAIRYEDAKVSQALVCASAGAGMRGRVHRAVSQASG
jgi:serine/threonine protein kinase